MLDAVSYTIKKHPQARHIKLRVSLRNGVEVVVPLKFNEKKVAAFVAEHQAWITKSLAKLQEKAARLPTVACFARPDEIRLTALDEVWQVRYIEHKKSEVIMTPQRVLIVSGNVTQVTVYKKILLHWLKARARVYLGDTLQRLSVATGLEYKALTVRGQQTIWGSCTAKKNISLNYKLIFLPVNLVEHIILHELAHTVHLNHSAAFWRLLARFDPQWNQHRKAVRQTADKLWVPGWV